MRSPDQSEGAPSRTGIAGLTAPAVWGETLSARPVIDRSITAIIPMTIRRWQGIVPVIEQVALNQHFVSIHLGGPKRLTRKGEGSSQVCEVTNGAHSIVPAGSAFDWNTEGPVDFAHLYFDVGAFDQILPQCFDRDPRQVTLRESLGVGDALIGSLAAALLEESGSDDLQQAYIDDLAHLFATRILRLHSNARAPGNLTCQLLAPYRLRRACDFIEANLAQPIGVAEIAAAAGISAYHFSRAFRQTAGRPPYAYLMERRISKAKGLLAERALSLTEISLNCGFTSLSQFSRTFRREAGTAPSHYRGAH